MDTQNDLNVLFYEEQRTERWVLLALAISAIIAIGALVALLVVLPKRAFDLGALRIVMPILAGLAAGQAFNFWLMIATRMITEVGPDGITVRTRPLDRRRTISFDQMASCEAETYNPMRIYGGWGIRIGRGRRAYRTSGNRGVQLVLTSGERILIGSQKADELAAEIQSRIGH